jgi:hypothetical protein
MDEHKDTGTGSFISGFLFGILAGLLFTTRKGRQIMRAVLNGQVTKFSELEGFLEQKMDEEREERLIGDTATSVPYERVIDPREEKLKEMTPKPEKKPRVKSSTQRFFKRKK